MSFKNFHNRLKNKVCHKDKLIQTKITIKTEELNKHLRRILVRNNQIDLVTGICGIITAISLIFQSLDRGEKVTVPSLLSAVTLAIGIAFALFSLCSCIRVFSSKTETLVNDIVEVTYENKDYTAIALMKAQIGGVSKILVRRQENWQSYFLPYCHFNENGSDKSIENSLKQELSHILDIPEHMFTITAYSKNPFHCIKRNISQDAARLIEFRFYFVEMATDVSRNRFMKSHFSQFSWKSKLELNQDIGTVNNNGDVLAIIDQESLIQKTPYAFSDNLLSYQESSRTFRIIWTITNKCKYSCNMCATNSGPDIKDSLTFEQKQKVLMNLASINLNIESLDISGGDPLLNVEDQKIIRQCYRLLPFTKISVTTTALGLDRIPLSELSNTVRNCDITYEIPYKKYEYEKDIQNPERLRPHDYNKSNFEILMRIREAGVAIDLNIHVPIHPETTNREDIEALLEDLEQIHPKSIKFIQLMPVGRLQADKIRDYDPKAFMELVDEIVSEKKYDFSISVSCALKTIDNILPGKRSRSCPMLEEKLGIDSKGNVFACMWAAYLSEYENKDVKENPFYLGCLMNESLDEIIKKSYPEIKKLKEDSNGKCPVCAKSYIKQI